jgi:hypothetical protein
MAPLVNKIVPLSRLFPTLGCPANLTILEGGLKIF